MQADAFPHAPLLLTLKDLAQYHGKDYCFPSQEKIQELLATRWGIHRSRRTINRWLDTLESMGLIRRQRRHTKDPAQGFTFRSTLYRFTAASRHIFRMVSGAARKIRGGSRVTYSAQQPSGISKHHQKEGANAPGSLEETPETRRRGVAELRAALTRNSGK